MYHKRPLCSQSHVCITQNSNTSINEQFLTLLNHDLWHGQTALDLWNNNFKANPRHLRCELCGPTPPTSLSPSLLHSSGEYGREPLNRCRPALMLEVKVRWADRGVRQGLVERRGCWTRPCNTSSAGDKQTVSSSILWFELVILWWRSANWILPLWIKNGWF